MCFNNLSNLIQIFKPAFVILQPHGLPLKYDVKKSGFLQSIFFCTVIVVAKESQYYIKYKVTFHRFNPILRKTDDKCENCKNKDQSKCNHEREALLHGRQTCTVNFTL